MPCRRRSAIAAASRAHRSSLARNTPGAPRGPCSGPPSVNASRQSMTPSAGRHARLISAIIARWCAEPWRSCIQSWRAPGTRLATSPTVFLSASVTWPPKRWVLQHIVCTAHAASVNRRGGGEARGPGAGGEGGEERGGRRGVRGGGERVVAVVVGLDRDVLALARLEVERLEARRHRLRPVGLHDDDDAPAGGRRGGAEPPP